MIYFLDTEFLENGPDKPITLVSIGIVCEEDGREYYAVSSEFDESDASDWVKENVLDGMNIPKEGPKKRKQIANDIIKFINKDSNPTFWADHCAYDWVVFCQIFGTMMDLPDNFPKYCHDIKVEEMKLGDPKMPEHSGREHDALEDAKHLMEKYRYIKKHMFTGNALNLKDLKEKIKSKNKH